MRNDPRTPDERPKKGEEDDGWGDEEILSDAPAGWEGIVSFQADFEKEKQAMAEWLKRTENTGTTLHE